MKVSWRILSILIFSVSIVFISGCKKSNPYSNTSITKSSSTVMKATISNKTTNTTMDIIPVLGGQLNVQTAWINIANLQIEENSGNDVEQDGEHNDGDQNEDNNETEDGKEDSLDASDIMIAGPFNLDISSGQALIGSFDVYPGTFRKIDFSFIP
jgi:hypothetical protein